VYLGSDKQSATRRVAGGPPTVGWGGGAKQSRLAGPETEERSDEHLAEPYSSLVLYLVGLYLLFLIRGGVSIEALGRDIVGWRCGLEVADRAIAFAREHEELTLESELLRLRGELLEPTRLAEAEAAYVDALARGIACGAHSFALRAATRLATMWHATPRSANGYDQLTAALGRIAPGTRTAEVIEARTRLSMRA